MNDEIAAAFTTLAERIEARAKERRTVDYPDNLMNDMLADALEELARDVRRAAQITSRSHS